MRLNTKVRYGLRAILEIASNEEGTLQKDISTSQEISSKYLDQIIASLKASGLIIRIHGKNGGYKITRDPKEITVYDVYKAFEYELNIEECQANGEDCIRTHGCRTRTYWCDLNKMIVHNMENETLADLLS